MTRHRIAAGLVLVLAGMAQIISGIRPVDGTRAWLLPDLPAAVTGWVAGLLLAISLVGLVGAGFALLGYAPLRRHWRAMARVGLGASILLLLPFWPAFALVVLLLDLAALGVVLRAPEPETAGVTRPRRGAARLASGAAPLVLGYLGLCAIIRPWYIRWGASEQEERLHIASDALTAEPALQTTRSVEIDAPAPVVWSWLAQVGRDRSGFYSYDFLERFVGFDVHNVYTIRPEWQRERPLGALVRAAPPDFMGGRFGPDFGWRVAMWQPNDLLALRATILDWAFKLVPVSARTTRLLVRARSTNPAGLRTALLTNVDFLGFGVIHFVMERKMMLTIKALSEASARAGGPGG